MPAGTSRAAIPGGSPVPVFRMKRGCAPPDTCTRSRCPAPNRCAVALIGTVSSVQAPSPLTRTSPSHTFHDRPRGSTSHSRANTSKEAPLPRARSRMLTGPMTSSGAPSASLVNTRTSCRASRALFRRGLAARESMPGPPTDGVGEAGS